MYQHLAARLPALCGEPMNVLREKCLGFLRLLCFKLIEKCHAISPKGPLFRNANSLKNIPLNWKPISPTVHYPKNKSQLFLWHVAPKNTHSP